MRWNSGGLDGDLVDDLDDPASTHEWGMGVLGEEDAAVSRRYSDPARGRIREEDDVTFGIVFANGVAAGGQRSPAHLLVARKHELDVDEAPMRLETRLGPVSSLAVFDDGKDPIAVDDMTPQRQRWQRRRCYMVEDVADARMDPPVAIGRVWCGQDHNGLPRAEDCFKVCLLQR